MQTRSEIQADVVARILEAMEGDLLPWRRSWTISRNSGLATSLSTGNVYTGINQLLLMCSAWKYGYESKWWGTFRQIKAMQGSVLKGQRGTRIVLFKPVKKTTIDANGDESESTFAIMKSFVVFNGQQTTLKHLHVDDPDESSTVFERHEAAERLIDSVGCTIRTGQQASYCPATDEVTLPAKHRFESPEAYYETAFHELSHFAESRTGFDRTVPGHSYGFGELVAEISACTLMAHFGLATQATNDNSAAYLKSWIEAIRQNHSVIFQAASQSAKTVSFLLNCVDDSGSTAEAQTPAMVAS
tara:strand:+ start:11401 stop:12303 length:903 start_codon:yes stop_codon:yes gene_type:complete